jgi:hypothetical protein
LALVAALLVVPACDEAAKKEATDLDRAFLAYREADNARRPELATRLEAVACTAKDVCDAKAACVATAKPTGEGLAKKHAVEAFMANELAKLAPGDPKALQMLAELDAAEKLLVRGRDAMPACDDAMRTLRKAHGLR